MCMFTTIFWRELSIWDTCEKSKTLENLEFYEHFRYLFTTDSFYEHFGEAKRFMELWVTKSHDKMSQIPMIKCRAISVANKNTPNSSYFWCQSSQGISVLSHTNASGVRISRSLVALQWPTFFFPFRHIMVDEYTNNKLRYNINDSSI